MANSIGRGEQQPEGVIKELRRWSGNGSQDVADTTEQGLERSESEGATPAGGLLTQRREISNTEMPLRRRSNGEDDTGRWHQETGRQSKPIRGEEYWSVERRLGEPTDGLPGRLDCNWGEGWEDGIPRVIKGQKNRVDRLKCLGNAVVPQQIYPILKGIADID